MPRDHNLSNQIPIDRGRLAPRLDRPIKWAESKLDLEIDIYDEISLG